jgi:hypothetical protein
MVESYDVALASFALLPVQQKVAQLAIAAMMIEHRDEREKLTHRQLGRHFNYTDRVYDYQVDIAKNLLGISSWPPADGAVIANGNAASLLKRAARRVTGSEATVLERLTFPLAMTSADGASGFLALISGFEMDQFQRGYEMWPPQSIIGHALSAKLLQISGMYEKVFLGQFTFNLADAPLPEPKIPAAYAGEFNFVKYDFSFGGQYARVGAFGVEFGNQI